MAILSSTIGLREVIFSFVLETVGVRIRLREASAYGRLSGGKKCRALVEKLPGPQLAIGIRLRDVSVRGGSTVS